MADRLTTQFKALLTIKSKSRLDTVADQYNRIFMIRIMLVCTVVMSISWYTDPMECIVPKSTQVAGKFVSAACWIQGVYVYKQLIGRVDNNMAYFGIPKNMDHEGIITNQDREDLCFLKPKLGVMPNPDCKGMTKTFFLQYQYMPFFIAALSVLYYLPYVLFCFVNKDKKELKDNINNRRKATKGEDVRTEGAHDVIKNYFPSFHRPNHAGMMRTVRERWRMTLIIVLNVIIKILYFVSNVLTLLLLDHVLNGEYVDYGSKFLQWSSLNNTIQYDYMGMREHPKPGNLLLPPFGYCEMYESSRDIKTTVANRYKFVCEVSQNILYQYCLVLFWFAIFGGYCASIIGLVHLFVSYFQLGMRRDEDFQDLKYLHLRELELLTFLRAKDIALYEECKEILRTRNVEKLNNESYSL